MASNEARQIVEAVSQNSPKDVTEAFNLYMAGACTDYIVALQEKVALNLVNEKVIPDMESAFDFVLEEIDAKGPKSIAEAVSLASQRYNVNKRELIQKLDETFNPEEDYESLAEEVINGLADLISEGQEGYIEFENNTVCEVNQDQAKAILKLWENLNFDNRRKMEVAMVSGVSGFQKVLEFAEGVK